MHAFGDAKGGIRHTDDELVNAKLLHGVRGGRLLEAGDLLDNDVRMALNVSSAIDLLRSREVVLLGVDEVTLGELATFDQRWRVRHTQPRGS